MLRHYERPVARTRFVALPVHGYILPDWSLDHEHRAVHIGSATGPFAQTPQYAPLAKVQGALVIGHNGYDALFNIRPRICIECRITPGGSVGLARRGILSDQVKAVVIERSLRGIEAAGL